MGSPNSLTDFMGAISDGVVKRCGFIVVIIPPLGLMYRYPKNVSYLCQQAEVPGKHFYTTEFITFGPTQNIPYAAQYNISGLRLSFLCSTPMNERWFFDAWHNLVEGTATHYFGYYDDYVGQVLIMQTDESGNPVYGTILTEAYPVTIPNTHLNTANGEVCQLDVVFNFKQWYTAESGLLASFGLDAEILGNAITGWLGGSVRNPIESSVGLARPQTFQMDGVSGVLSNTAIPSMNSFINCR